MSHLDFAMWLLHPTSFLTKSTSRGNGSEDRRAFLSEGVIHSLYELISRGEFVQCSANTCGICFLSSRNTTWGTVRVGFVPGDCSFLSTELQRSWFPKTDLIAFRAGVKLSSGALFSLIKNDFFEHAKIFYRWQNISLMWSCLLEENTTSSRIAEAQFPTDKPRAQTTACFFVKT